ncbi:MAG: hypothetical protein M3137_01870 [Actinomycetota bacterium]|nr:hypothetical protein [Actinomycetota bacterium]
MPRTFVETEAVDILELELRQIPRVLGVGIDREDHALTVHLLTTAPAPHLMLLRSASEIARNHTTGQVVLTVSVSAPRPEPTLAERVEAVRLVEARSGGSSDVGDDLGEVVVELAYRKQVASGLCVGPGPRAAATATLIALSNLGLDVPLRLGAALRLVGWLPERQVVVVALSSVDGGADCLGAGQGTTVAEAACLAVLQAVTRAKKGDGIPGR